MNERDKIKNRYREESPDGKITTYVTIYADGRMKKEICKYVAGRLFGTPEIITTYPDGTSVKKMDYKWGTIWEITHPDGTVEKKESLTGACQALKRLWEINSGASRPYIPDDKVELEDLDVHGF